MAIYIRGRSKTQLAFFFFFFTCIFLLPQQIYLFAKIISYAFSVSVTLKKIAFVEVVENNEV